MENFSSRALDEGEPYRVIPTRQLTDNYAYLIIDNASNECAVVDVSEYAAVLKVINSNNLKCTSILTTHYHADHSGGNLQLVEALDSSVKVFGGEMKIPGLTNQVGHKDRIKVGQLEINCYFTPCHTKGRRIGIIIFICRGHVLFEVLGAKQNSLFTGDTLFVGGCGKFFEGTAKEMHYALNEVVGGLPDNTLIWCGHEYTCSNLAFALSVDPENAVLQKKSKWAQAQVKNGEMTIPSTVAEEKTYNPFMRVGVNAIKKAVGSESDDDAETMRKLREAKNNFSYSILSRV